VEGCEESERKIPFLFLLIFFFFLIGFAICGEIWDLREFERERSELG